MWARTNKSVYICSEIKGTERWRVHPDCLRSWISAAHYVPESTLILMTEGGERKKQKKTHTNRLCIELQCSLLVNFKRLRSHYHVGVTQIGFSAWLTEDYVDARSDLFKKSDLSHFVCGPILDMYPISGHVRWIWIIRLEFMWVFPPTYLCKSWKHIIV